MSKRSNQRSTLPLSQTLALTRQIRGPLNERCIRGMPRGAFPQPAHFLYIQTPWPMIKMSSIKHTTQIPLRGKIVQVFTRPSDGHAAFTTSLRLDARFVKMPRVLLHHLLAAPDAPPVLRSKPVNSPAPGFEAQTGKPATSDVDSCPSSCQVPRCFQDLLCSRRTDSLLELAIAFLLDLADVVFITPVYSCSFVHHVDRP